MWQGKISVHHSILWDWSGLRVSLSQDKVLEDPSKNSRVNSQPMRLIGSIHGSSSTKDFGHRELTPLVRLGSQQSIQFQQMK